MDHSNNSIRQDLAGKYEIIQKLGAGSFGSVYKAMRKDGKLVAIKELLLFNKEQRDANKNEIEISKLVNEGQEKGIRSKHVVTILEGILNKSNTKMYIVMEYIEGENMLDFIQKRTGNLKQYYTLLLKYTRDIAEGLEYLHTNNLIHNDIKHQNIMIDKTGTAKIVDLGLGCINPKLVCSFRGGTTFYMAPEVFRTGMHTPASDMWSLGIMLYYSVIFRFPYKITDFRDSKLQDEIKSINYNITVDTCNPYINTVINNLLKINPNERATAKQIRQYLDTTR